MSWKKDRDALIAQTMAFVQSVTGRREETARPNIGVAPASPEPRLAPADASPAPKALAPVPRPEPLPNLATPRPLVAGDVASEIRARIDGFRAHQERFNREREEYFSQTLAKLKAAINEMPPPRLGK